MFFAVARFRPRARMLNLTKEQKTCDQPMREIPDEHLEPERQGAADNRRSEGVPKNSLGDPPENPGQRGVTPEQSTSAFGKDATDGPGPPGQIFSVTSRFPSIDVSPASDAAPAPKHVETSRARSLGRRHGPGPRMLAAVIALLPITALAVARALEPSSSGLGTHHQLGLPPCSMRVLLGIRCPGCGMTTSWSHFTRGNWQQSLETNVGGFCFALLAIWIAYLATVTTVTARPPSPSQQKWVALIGAGIFLVSLIQWAHRLVG